MLQPAITNTDAAPTMDDFLNEVVIWCCCKVLIIVRPDCFLVWTQDWKAGRSNLEYNEQNVSGDCLQFTYGIRTNLDRLPYALEYSAVSMLNRMVESSVLVVEENDYGA